MRPILTIVDDFLPDPERIRVAVIARGFVDRPFEGVTYHTVNVDYQPTEISAALCELYGRPINIHVSAFRQGKAGSPLHNLVHADNTCSSLASVLYLNRNDELPRESGTAFWKHKATGWEQQPTEAQLSERGLTIEGFCADWHNPDAWEMVFLARAKYNRLITYPTVRFHSRWPWSGFGENEVEARLVHCAFFEVL